MDIYALRKKYLPKQEKLKNKKSVKPVIYQTTKTRSVINLKWLCFLLMGLLTLEWFMRRYHGSY